VIYGMISTTYAGLENSFTSGRMNRTGGELRERKI
jgi:hypothetical protein